MEPFPLIYENIERSSTSIDDFSNFEYFILSDFDYFTLTSKFSLIDSLKPKANFDAR